MHDLDPNYSLPLWRSVVSYFRHYRPLVQAEQSFPATQPLRARTAAGAGPRKPMKESA